MNKKLKNALENCSSEHGFAIPIAVGMGLIMILIGSTMIVRSQGDQVTASAQKQTAQSLSITEAGIARTMSGFTKKQARSLLKLNHDPDQLLSSSDPDEQWDGLSLAPSMNPCDTDEASEVIPDEDTIGSGASTGTYKLLAYRYDSAAKTGTLLIQGETNVASATSQVRVVFPVIEFSSDITLTSLMAKDIDLKKVNVTGSITCTDLSSCPLSCSAGDSAPTLQQLKDAIGAESLAIITNPTDNTQPPVINVGSVELPNVPAVPVGATIISLGNVTSNQEIPSNTDIDAHTPGTPYYFKIDSINEAEILIENSITDPVYLYVTGNIEQKGNDDIRFKDSHIPAPGQIRIYGANTDGTLPTSQTFQFDGNSCTMAFIHAPNAAVGIDGGGNGCSELSGQPNIYGGVWVKTFGLIGNPTNSAILVEQPNLLTTLASSGLVPQIPGPSGFTTWQREAAAP